MKPKAKETKAVHFHRFPEGMKDKLGGLAKASGQTLTGYINGILSEHLRKAERQAKADAAI